MGRRVEFAKGRAMTCVRAHGAKPWHFGRNKARGGAFVTHEQAPLWRLPSPSSQNGRSRSGFLE